MSLDLKEIKQIIELMETSELSEFEIEKEGLKIRIHRSIGANGVAHTIIPQPAAAPVSSPAPTQDAATADNGLEVIKSPMVGTFYAAASPENPPFVSSGTVVSPDSTVAIIEAMKVMNEIHAEVSGEVVEILVQNGQSVEFGQPLFKVRPK